MRAINLIVSRSRNNVIGRNGIIPWELKAESKWFKELTLGNTVIMGHNTYKHIGQMCHRVNIVVTKTKKYVSYDDDTVLVSAPSLTDAIDMAPDNTEIYIIGGMQLYEDALTCDLVDRMYITEVNTHIEPDDTTIFFPEFDRDEFQKITVETADEEMPYTRTIYIKKNSEALFTGHYAADFEWKAQKVKGDHETDRCHAKLPDGTGFISNVRIKYPGIDGYCRMLYRIQESNGFSGITGMSDFPEDVNTIEEAKAAVPALLCEMLRKKRAGYEEKIASINRVLLMIQKGED